MSNSAAGEQRERETGDDERQWLVDLNHTVAILNCWGDKLYLKRKQLCTEKQCKLLKEELLLAQIAPLVKLFVIKCKHCYSKI